MFDEILIEKIANKTAEIITSTLNRLPVERRYLNVAEAAMYTSYTQDAIRYHIKMRHFPVSREGNSIRIDRHELDRWMERNKA